MCGHTAPLRETYLSLLPKRIAQQPCCTFYFMHFVFSLGQLYHLSDFYFVTKSTWYEHLILCFIVISVKNLLRSLNHFMLNLPRRTYSWINLLYCFCFIVLYYIFLSNNSGQPLIKSGKNSIGRVRWGKICLPLTSPCTGALLLVDLWFNLLAIIIN